MDFRFTKTTTIIVMCLALASNAEASMYSFSETIQGVNITGSFIGTALGNLISNLSDISVAFNGINFSTPLEADSWVNYSWNIGSGVASFDGTQNNFLFINTGYFTSSISSPNFLENRSPPNTFSYANGLHTASNMDFSSDTILTSWNIAAVPEPSEWAMMLLGLPLLGWSMRRKSA